MCCLQPQGELAVQGAALRQEQKWWKVAVSHGGAIRVRFSRWQSFCVQYGAFSGVIFQCFTAVFAEVAFYVLWKRVCQIRNRINVAIV